MHNILKGRVGGQPHNPKANTKFVQRACMISITNFDYYSRWPISIINLDD